MTASPEQAYLESRVYTATPGELIQMLYEAALEGIQSAIAAVEAGDIARRARSITKASSCVMELAGSLNVAAAGELGVRLAVLYEYLLHELLEANVKQSPEPLRNCERVVSSLLEGWTTALKQIDGAVAGADSHPSDSSAPVAGAALPESTEVPQASAPPRHPASPTFVSPALRNTEAEVGDEEAFDIEELQPAMNSWCG